MRCQAHKSDEPTFFFQQLLSACYLFYAQTLTEQLKLSLIAQLNYRAQEEVSYQVEQDKGTSWSR